MSAAQESWIERAARLHPARVAVAAPDGTLHHAALNAASRRVADELRAAGYGPGTHVAIPAAPGARFAAALHGCLRAGVVAVPIDPRLAPEQQAQRRGRCAGELDEAGLSDIVARTTPAPDPSPSGHRPFAGTGADAATPAVLLFTSGSTGPGTPVLLSRGNLLWNALGSAAALGQPASERWLSAMPVAHVGGLTVLTRSAIGATTAVLRATFDTHEQVALLMAGEATITSVVPTMLSRMLDAGLDRPPRLRLVLLGGSPISGELTARAADAGIPIAPTYGMTEATSQVVTAGAPLFCTRVALRADLDPQAHASGAADEILVQGPTVAGGVAGSNGWLATGDRGRRDASGAFHVIGRLAETIITGGENVAPTEVEAHLLALPGVADAAVLGIPDAEWGQRVEARVVLAAGATLDIAAARAALRASLPPFAIPKAITVVDQLPRTPTGKLRRADLR